jgi:hypothetical protein
MRRESRAERLAHDARRDFARGHDARAPDCFEQHPVELAARRLLVRGGCGEDVGGVEVVGARQRPCQRDCLSE